MMSQCLGGTCGATPSATGSACCAASSTVGTSASPPTPAVPSPSACSSKSSCSSAISRLFGEVLQHRFHAPRQNRIDNREIGGEGEHADNHHSRRTFHLFAIRPSHAAHLQLEIVEVILRV